MKNDEMPDAITVDYLYAPAPMSEYFYSVRDDGKPKCEIEATSQYHNTAKLLAEIEGMKEYETALTPLNTRKVAHNAALDAVIQKIKEMRNE